MFRKHSLPIFFCAITLSILGVFTLISTNLNAEGNIDLSGIVSKQIIFVLFGFGLYFLASIIDFTYFKYWQLLVGIYVFVLLLLILTAVFGSPINNAQRWLFIGGENGFQLQPSELAKIVVIFLTAGILSQKKRFNDLTLAVLNFLLLIPILVLVYIQPHGSMTLILLAIWGILTLTFLDNQLRNYLLLAITISSIIGTVMLSIGNVVLGITLMIVAVAVTVMGYYSRARWKQLFVIALVLGLILGFAGTFVWDRVLAPYQQARIQSFISPSKETEAIDRNIRESRIAIGSGRIFGKGFGFGTQSRLNFIPEHRTDFIFAAYAEQFGLVGSLILIAIYGYLIIRIISISMGSGYDLFTSIVAVGIGVKILLEVFINIGTNTGAIPATGIPLPLISYGGTITLTTLLSLGIIQSLISHKKNVVNMQDDIDSEDLLI